MPRRRWGCRRRLAVSGVLRRPGFGLVLQVVVRVVKSVFALGDARGCELASMREVPQVRDGRVAGRRGLIQHLAVECRRSVDAIAQHQRIVTVGGVVPMDDAFFGGQAMEERRIRLAILHAVFARFVTCGVRGTYTEDTTFLQ